MNYYYYLVCKLYEIKSICKIEMHCLHTKRLIPEDGGSWVINYLGFVIPKKNTQNEP